MTTSSPSRCPPISIGSSPTSSSRNANRAAATDPDTADSAFAEPADRGSIGRIALDANALDLDGSDRDVLALRFRALMRAGLVEVVVTDGVARELHHPHVPTASRDGLRRSPGAVRKAPTAAQQIARIRVRAIMRGDAASDRHAADAGHLCDAAEAGCAYFLTRDKRFSRKRRDLDAALPSIRVLGLREFFESYDAASPDEA